MFSTIFERLGFIVVALKSDVRANTGGEYRFWSTRYGGLDNEARVTILYFAKPSKKP